MDTKKTILIIQKTREFIKLYSIIYSFSKCDFKGTYMQIYISG